MPKYKTTMSVYGLDRGETFESDDPRWADMVKAGFVTVVEQSGLRAVPDESKVETGEVYQRNLFEEDDDEADVDGQ